MTRDDRRQFLHKSTAATLGAAVVLARPSLARGTAANDAISIGMIGCGGRGGWIADLFAKTGQFRLVACADYYPDRVAAFGERFRIPTGRRFASLSAYKNLLDEELDAVVIESPPCFHPEQTQAAIAAGRHVFLSKPVAVDVPGSLAIAAAGRHATEKRLVLLVDFQTRANGAYQETVRRVHSGAVGELVGIEAHYPWSGMVHDLALPSPEERLRYWYQTLATSGDVIVEQDVHALDVASWFADADPEWAIGTGGRAVRKHGDIWDHFSVVYQFPNGLLLTFTSQKGVPGVRDEISCRVFGTLGVAETDYMGEVCIRGKNPYPGAMMTDLYTSGTQRNIETFHRCITQGTYENATVAPSVRANLIAVLGRTAAYQRREVTWKQLLAAGEPLVPDLAGLRS